MLRFELQYHGNLGQTVFCVQKCICLSVGSVSALLKQHNKHLIEVKSNPTKLDMKPLNKKVMDWILGNEHKMKCMSAKIQATQP